MKAKKSLRRDKIRFRIRKKMRGTSACPRLAVYRSNKDIYAQIIDDGSGTTLVSASTREKGFKSTGKKIELSAKVGKQLAEKALGAGITSVVFDRGGYLYHGRVKALADGAREGGLKF